jgi:signal transduction histidine kinase
VLVFVDRTAMLWETDPEKLSDRQLQVLADYLVKKAEEEEIKAKRQIEAGIAAEAVVSRRRRLK